MRVLLPVALLVLAGLAGCVQQAAPVEPAASGADAPADDALAPLDLLGSGCVQGGGHSVHPRSLWEKGVVRVVPDPWVPADVWDDVGPQALWSEIPDPERPVPEKGNTMGNYHATMWCGSWTLQGEPKEGAFVGFVGMKVEHPPFGSADTTHDYVVTVLATNDDDVHAALDAAGFHPMKATATRDELPDGTLRIRMHTDRNGDYDSLFKPQPYGDMKAERVRLWFQQSAEGHGDHGGHGETEGAHAKGAFRPIALDLVSTGGRHLVAAGQGYFSHSGTDHHAPLPGAHGHTAAVLYDGFDVSLSWGPRPDVTLDWAYVH